MLDHMHLLTDCPNTSAEVLRYIKGITGRRVIDYLKEKHYVSSLVCHGRSETFRTSDGTAENKSVRIQERSSTTCAIACSVVCDSDKCAAVAPDELRSSNTGP